MVWSPGCSAPRAGRRDLGRCADPGHRARRAGRGVAPGRPGRRRARGAVHALLGRRAARRARPGPDPVARAGVGPVGRGRASTAIPGRTGWCRTSSPRPGCWAGLPDREPVAVHARAGRYCYDTMTLVGPGTWEAARAAVDVAATAADLAWSGGEGHLRAVPAAGSPRDPLGLRRVVLPQQRRGRRRAAAPARRRAGSPSSTSTPTTATGRSRCSTTARTCCTPRCTSTRVPAGSRTSPGSPTRPAVGRRRGRTSTCPWRPAAVTSAGWPRVARSLPPQRASRPDALVVSLGLDAARVGSGEPAGGDRGRLPGGR